MDKNKKAKNIREQIWNKRKLAVGAKLERQTLEVQRKLKCNWQNVEEECFRIGSGARMRRL